MPENFKDMISILEDPMRLKIFKEIFVNTEISAIELLEILPINRSTLSFHLSKMVNSNLLSVRINPEGRPIKYYKINLEFNAPLKSNNKFHKITFIKNQMQRMIFEFQIASILLSDLMINQTSNLTNLKVNESHLQFKSKKDYIDIFNGGIYQIDQKDAKQVFVKIYSILEEYSGKELSENEITLILGGFNSSIQSDSQETNKQDYQPSLDEFF